MNIHRRTLPALLAAPGLALAQAPTRIRLGHTNAADWTAAFIARDQGFFARRGLEVELTAIAIGSNIPAALQSASIDIGGPTPPIVIQAIEGGIDLVLVSGASFTSSTSRMFGLVARNDIGATTPQELAQRRIGVPGINAVMHVMFRQWLQDKGVDFRRVRFIEVPFAQMNDALRSSSVEVVVASEPAMSRIQQSGNGRILNYFAQELKEDTLVTAYTARRDWAERNAAAARLFREAIAEGSAFATANDEVARRTVARYLNTPEEVVPLIAIPVLKTEISQVQVTDWVTMMQGQGMLRGQPNVSNILFR